ncbi:PPE domain-containing protein [Mycobacterium ostraviense]|nr:PPE domain-containing protein [Mycobacterium ostraviense]UGT94242.1 PPE domain-containing protein [Mycobacterium ostraviense]
MLSAAAAWEGLAAELDAAADAFLSVTSGLVDQAWQGPASQAMAAAAAPSAGWLTKTVGRCGGVTARAAIAGVSRGSESAAGRPACRAPAASPGARARRRL